jgi:phosphate transport system substrate-binding protein
MNNRSFAALCILAALTGFGFAAPAAAQSIALEIVGTGDGIDVLQALAAAFRDHEKSIRVEIPPSIGSGGGIAAVGSGKFTLGRIARKLSPAESATGIVYKPFARLPSAFFVHSSSGVTSLTTTQLLAVYSGGVTNWKELGGADLRIRVVRREDADSTLTGLRAAMPGWKDQARKFIDFVTTPKARGIIAAMGNVPAS